MASEERTAAPQRVDLEQLRAQDKARKEAASAGQKIKHPDGREEFRQKGNDALTALEVAKAGKGTQFPTFVSKHKRLQVMIHSGGTVVVGTRVVETAPRFIQFENQLYTCKDQDEVDFMLKSPELGNRFWTQAEFSKMQTANVERLRDEATRHLKLVELELGGATDPAHPGDRDISAGMQAGPDKATEFPNVRVDSDGLPVLIEDGG